MNIEPNTTIYLMRGVPLDAGYTDTIYFATAEKQKEYFDTFITAALTFVNQTYQRVSVNRCRLQVSADSIYNVNYMAFQNTAYGTKWFYAFVTNVEYINNAVSEITYVLDVMQTYAFDYVLKQSFVDREHSATDVAGDNILAEPFDVGDYVVEDWQTDPWIRQQNLTITGRGEVEGGYCVLICAAEQNV